MYAKFSPNEYIIRYRNGKIVAEGVGLSFFFMDYNTSVVSIPISDNVADFFFEERTQDFQVVSVQGQITYRIADFKKIVEALDFTMDMARKGYKSDVKPIEKLSKRIINIAEVLVKSHVGARALTDALRSSQDLAGAVLAELQANEELTALGVKVLGFSLLKVATNSETARALEAGTREAILKQADDALYERRNASIEQERIVKENELNTELSVGLKNKEIKESEIATKKMILEKENELTKLKVESDNEIKRMQLEKENELARLKVESDNEIERSRLENEAYLEQKRKELADVKLENAKKEAEAEGYRVSAIMDAYGKMSPEVLVALATMNMEPEKLIAQAFEKLACNSEKIGQLNITPDLLESVMNKGTR